MSEIMTPGKVTLATLERIWREGRAARLDRAVKADVEAAAALVARAAAGDEAVYGVNTGFGKLASVKLTLSEETVPLSNFCWFLRKLMRKSDGTVLRHRRFPPFKRILNRLPDCIRLHHAFTYKN